MTATHEALMFLLANLGKTTHDPGVQSLAFRLSSKVQDESSADPGAVAVPEPTHPVSPIHTVDAQAFKNAAPQIAAALHSVIAAPVAPAPGGPKAPEPAPIVVPPAPAALQPAGPQVVIPPVVK